MVTIVAACAFAAVVWLAPASPNSSLCDGLLAPIYCAFIWAFSNSEWRPARLLSARWLVLLGEASFGLYLIHTPIFHIFEHYRWINRPEFFPVYLVLCIGLSVISFLALETPSRRWLLKRGHTQTKETMEVASAAQ